MGERLEGLMLEFDHDVRAVLQQVEDVGQVAGEDRGSVGLLAAQPDVLAGGALLLLLGERPIVGDDDGVGVLGVDGLVLVVSEPATRLDRKSVV